MDLLKMETQGSNAKQNWYALFTRYQHEKSVACALSNKGHEVYLPLYHSVRQWRDRAKRLCLPLFPCYVFICGGMDRQLQILTTPGVLHILRSTGRPAIVPHAQLDAVRQIIESSLGVEPYPFLNCGDRVKVKAGPLLGLEGILTRKKGTVRLVVSMEILGRSAAVEIDLLHVERIAPCPATKFLYPIAISA